jgi:copper(I)-binding protein
MSVFSFNRLRVSLLVLGLAALALGLVACGDDDDDAAAEATVPGESASSDIQVNDAFVRSSTDDLGAAYFTITGGDEDDRRVSITAEGVEKAEMHDTVTEGISEKMVPIEDGVEVPAHGTVNFETGKKHVMLINPEQPLEVGDTVTLTFEFEKAGEITVEAPVESYAPGAADDHSDHATDDHESDDQSSTTVIPRG